MEIPEDVQRAAKEAYEWRQAPWVESLKIDAVYFGIDIGWNLELTFTGCCVSVCCRTAIMPQELLWASMTQCAARLLVKLERKHKRQREAGGYEIPPVPLETLKRVTDQARQLGAACRSTRRALAVLVSAHDDMVAAISRHERKGKRS